MTVKKKLPKGITERKGKKKTTYTCRYQYNGQRHTITADTVKEVQRQLKELQYKLENDIQEEIKPKELERITLNEWFDIWSRDYKELKVKQHTLDLYKQQYRNHIKAVFGNRYIDDIKPEHVQSFYNNLARCNYKGGTVENIMMIFCDMMKQAYINERIEKNPCNHIVKPRLRDAEKKNILLWENEKIFLCYCKNEKYKNIFIVALYSGMRVNEILGLTWQDIDFKNNTIHVNHTLIYKSKNNYYLSSPKSKTSKRDIPIVSNVLRIFEQMYNNQPKDSFVFVDNYNRACSVTTLNVYIYRIVSKMQNDNINIKHLSMHSFRHTFATRCIEQGVTPQTLKSILGHASLSMTMDLYAHVQDETKQKEIQKLENLLQ